MALAAVALSTAALYSTGMLSSISQALARPIVNDVATDLEKPPQFSSSSSTSSTSSSTTSSSPGPVPLPEEFKPQIRQAYPDLKPLVVPDADADAVFAAAEKLARSREGWEVSLAESSSGTLQGVATTRMLRFKDDIAFRVKKRDEKGSTVVVVDGRSRSRLGKGDLGANAARLEAFLSDLKEELLLSK